MSDANATRVQIPQPQSIVARILAEGENDLLGAARAAGCQRLPNIFAMMREARSGRLEAFKSQGRWRTSAAAVVRWLERQQRHAAAPATEARADANSVLRHDGLGRDQVGTA